MAWPKGQVKVSPSSVVKEQHIPTDCSGLHNPGKSVYADVDASATWCIVEEKTSHVVDHFNG